MPESAASPAGRAPPAWPLTRASSAPSGPLQADRIDARAPRPPRDQATGAASESAPPSTDCISKRVSRAARATRASSDGASPLSSPSSDTSSARRIGRLTQLAVEEAREVDVGAARTGSAAWCRPCRRSRCHRSRVTFPPSTFACRLRTRSSRPSKRASRSRSFTRAPSKRPRRSASCSAPSSCGASRVPPTCSLSVPLPAEGAARQRGVESREVQVAFELEVERARRGQARAPAAR